MKTGKLKDRKIKLVWKHPDGYPSPTRYYYAEAGETVYWDGESKGNPKFYGGREILWCNLWSGEHLGLTKEEVEWEEEAL